MKVTNKSNRKEVYNAPIIHWSNDTYTPISNKFIMDMLTDKINNMGLIVRSESYKTALTQDGRIKGVIGGLNISTDNENYGQRIMFRNSYDKSMSFAITVGSVVWICENGCVSGDYQYKRIHRGVITGDTSTTQDDIVENINGSFQYLETAFTKVTGQLDELKHFQISPIESYKLIGELFFKQEVINITQMSIIKRELVQSNNFRHIGDTDFTAYDLYNHITESLKSSSPYSYVKDHIATHKLFEQTFNI